LVSTVVVFDGYSGAYLGLHFLSELLAGW